MPTPDQFGRFRVAEVVGGKTRHYSTSTYIQGVHTIVQGPDSAASFDNGQERPPKFNVGDKPADKPADSTSPKGA